MGALAGGVIGAGADIYGAMLSSKEQQQANEANIAFQTAAAQHGIQWKVDDAKAAGINPLYALGAPTSSPGEIIQPDTNLGTGVQKAGQDLSRAVTASMSQENREHVDAMDALNLEHAKLSNDLLRAQVSNAKANQPVNPPGPALYGNLEGVPAASGPQRLTPSEKAIWDNVQKKSKEAADQGWSWRDVSRGLSDLFHASRLYQMWNH